MSVAILEEAARLKRMRWSQLERVAYEAGLTSAQIRRPQTINEMRRAILEAKFPSLKEEPANA